MSRQRGASVRLSVANNLKGLLRFSGRQDRADFWPYALMAFGLGLIVAMVGFMGPFLETMAEMQNYAAAHPEQVTISSGPGHYSITVHGDAPEFTDAREMLLSMAPGAVVMIVLLAASVTRRLHDSGLSGLFGLMPIVLAIPAGRWTIAVFDAPLEDAVSSGLHLQAFLLTMLYNLSIVLLVVLLCRGSTKGDNRHGPSTVAA